MKEEEEEEEEEEDEDDEVELNDYSYQLNGIVVHSGWEKERERETYILPLTFF